jgi:hypothetical protein
MYNSFWDYLSSMSSRDWDDLIFSHRVDLLEEAFSLLDIIPTRGKSTYGGEHRKFIGAMLKALIEDEPFLMPSRNVNEWLPFSSSSAVSWIDAMAHKGLVKYDRDRRLLIATDLLKQLSQPTMSVLEL